MRIFGTLAMAAATVATVSAALAQAPDASTGTRVRVPFKLSSPAFPPEGPIPRDHSCLGADMSPAMQWGDPPLGTQSFALIMDDPGAPAGDWIHWVVWNIPVQVRALPQNLPKQEELSDGTRQGRNDFMKIGYNGPCPPGGKTHRYRFRLYALSVPKLNLPSGSAKPDVEPLIKERLVGTAEYWGTFKRQ